MSVTGRIILCSFAIGIGLLIAPHAALACTCELPRPGKTLRQQVREARGKSKAVFSGRVVEVVEHPQAFYVEVKFKVQRAWKQVRTDEITIRTGRGGGDCGYRFEVGENYLVYAYGSDENKLETNICQRTRRLADAGEDLKLLGNGKTLSTAQEPQQASNPAPCSATKGKKTVRRFIR